MARDFNGSSDYLTYAVDDTIDTRTDTVAVSYWINLDANNAEQTHWMNGYSGGSGRGWGLRNNSSGKAQLDIAFVAGITSSTTLTTGTWFHIIGKNDGTNWRLYINGTEEGTSVTDSPFAIEGESETTIGNRKNDDGTYGTYTNGQIAEIAYWARDLDTSEVTALSLGYSPAFFARSLTFYKPFVRSATVDYKDSTSWSVNGTSASAHPRIIYPSPTQIRRFSTAAVAAEAKPSTFSMMGV